VRRAALLSALVAHAELAAWSVTLFFAGPARSASAKAYYVSNMSVGSGHTRGTSHAPATSCGIELLLQLMSGSLQDKCVALPVPSVGV
jgi:hypothetical protein